VLEEALVQFGWIRECVDHLGHHSQADEAENHCGSEEGFVNGSSLEVDGETIGFLKRKEAIRSRILGLIHPFSNLVLGLDELDLLVALMDILSHCGAGKLAGVCKQTYCGLRRELHENFVLGKIATIHDSENYVI
jgi:hypothetical protein